MPNPIPPAQPPQRDWTVRPSAPPAASPTVPAITSPAASSPPAQVYGPPAPRDSADSVGSYARDDFEQYRFPDAEASGFAPRPLDEVLDEAIDNFKDERPITTAVLGATAAAAAGRIEFDRPILGGRGEIEFSARYDNDAKRTDPLTGNRQRTGQDEIRAGVQIRIPLGGN